MIVYPVPLSNCQELLLEKERIKKMLKNVNVKFQILPYINSISYNQLHYRIQPTTTSHYTLARVNPSGISVKYHFHINYHHHHNDKGFTISWRWPSTNRPDPLSSSCITHIHHFFPVWQHTQPPPPTPQIRCLPFAITTQSHGWKQIRRFYAFRNKRRELLLFIHWINLMRKRTVE